MNMKSLSHREKQDLFKKVFYRASLDRQFRELCLVDSSKALETILGRKLCSSDQIRFLEEDGAEINNGELAVILPSLLKKTWLSD